MKDPLALEAFRTKVRDAIEPEASTAWEADISVDPDAPTAMLVGLLTEARWEYRTNDAGVPVRRVVVATEWETDPAPVKRDIETGKAGQHVENCGCMFYQGAYLVRDAACAATRAASR